MKKGCKRICDFTINHRVYTIYDVAKIVGKDSYVGQTDYNTRHIYIEGLNYNERLITLKHELIHVWLYEHGYQYQHERMCFGVEDVCEIAAYSNTFLNDVVAKYIGKDK